MLDLIVRILAWVLEHRRQRERRRALYLATLGIDTGPRYIHGVRIPAAGGAR
ncbi:hypothetical protein ACFV9W_04655 [Streptomyces sp. NPDC059897]|uniref:hypothetical protein n=1 Tax=Streptomyces sp. NPDC059897 TaxID=3346994 RepID=UPI003663112F